jgi:tetratricopeptide (TPR) repeat protein
MSLWLAALLACWPLAAQDQFAKLGQDLKQAASELGISDLRASVVKSGRVVWTNGAIEARAPEEPVIAERITRLAERGKISLDAPAPLPPGATIRQVLANTADGTPGEEVLDNRSFFDALKPIAGNASMPGVMKFALEKHAALGWFQQDYAGQRLLWNYSPSVILVKLPAMKLTLIVSANSTALTAAARLEDGNIARSTIALALLGGSERDELIDHALIALYRGQNEKSAALVHQALDKFPELESTPDVTLLYLFAQLRLKETEASATAVIRDHPSLPTAWFYYGQYLENSKRYREAAACFEKITMHQPPWHNWTVAAAKKELTYLKTY